MHTHTHARSRTTVGVGALGGHGGAQAVVAHPLPAGPPLQLLQPHAQLPLLPAQAAFQLLRPLVLLLQLLQDTNTTTQTQQHKMNEVKR